MKIVNSYKCRITNANDIFKPTITIYRAALAYVIDVADRNYEVLSPLQGKDRNNLIEHLIHGTSDNPNPKYDFDKEFYKFPSYLRRCVVQDAIGIVSSYRANLENYENERHEAISNGRKFKKRKPVLQADHFKFPALYKGNMFNRLTRDEAEIKIYHNNDWVWFKVKLRNQDIKYIENHTMDSNELNPLLVKEKSKYYLQFSYEKYIKANTVPLKKRTVLSIDLGVNNSAVCSIIKYDGTVAGRLFINQPAEKDRLYRLTGRLCKVQHKSGRKSKLPNIWRKINNLNKQIANDTVKRIMEYAVENSVDVIVFEYLGTMPKIKGSKAKRTRMKLQHWNKIRIQKKLEHKAHANSMRYSRVNAVNTSNLAYDGSGEVTRNEHNYSLCTFVTGKQYNCDLSASYNIGARYFIREILKSCSENDRLLFSAKVPETENRTKCTLSTLISMTKAA